MDLRGTARRLHRRAGGQPGALFLVVVLWVVAAEGFAGALSGWTPAVAGALSEMASWWERRMISGDEAWVLSPGRLTSVAVGGVLHAWAPDEPAAHYLVLLLAHAANAALIAWLALRLGLSRAAAAASAALFFGAPRLLGMLSLEYVCEITLLTAYLLVVGAFLGRRDARSRSRRYAWLAVELLAAFLGYQSKESFPVYLGLLAVIEILDVEDQSRAGLRRAAARGFRRLLPHVLLAILCLPSVLEIVGHETHRKPVDFAPGNLLSNIADRIGAVASTEPAVTPFVVAVALALVLAFAISGPTRRARRFAGLAFVIVSVPTAIFADRHELGYAYQPWAFAALAVAALAPAAFRWRYVLSRAVATAIVAVVLAGGFAPERRTAQSSLERTTADEFAVLRWSIRSGQVAFCSADGGGDRWTAATDGACGTEPVDPQTLPRRPSGAEPRE